MRISMVMPAYNEESNISDTVRRCFNALAAIDGDHEVVVTDDGSRDRTGEILTDLQAEFPTLKIVRHSPNQGYGAALSAAISESSGEIVISLDSDGQFDPEDGIRLVDRFGPETDVLTGYRESKKDTLFRVMADRIMNIMIRLIFWVKFRDTNCALKLYRGDFVRDLFLETRGFQIPTEIVLKSHALGFRVEEAPVSHRPREGGASALAPFKTAFQMTAFLFYLKLKILLFRRGILRSL